MKLIKYQCECCGGSIDPKTLKCEYCGMAYRKENNGVTEQLFRIEHVYNPVDTLVSRQTIPHEALINLGPEEAAEMAIHKLSRELAEVIAPYMKIEHSYNYERNMQEVTAEIKIVRPV